MYDWTYAYENNMYIFLKNSWVYEIPTCQVLNIYEKILDIF